MPHRQTDRQTTEDRATQLLYSIQFKLSHAMLGGGLKFKFAKNKLGMTLTTRKKEEKS